MTEDTGSLSSYVYLTESGMQTSIGSTSALTLLLFDHLLTFRDEVDLFWGTPCTVPKAIYNRYFTAAVVGFITYIDHRRDLSTSVCAQMLLLSNIGAAVVSLTMDLILLFRVWILYDRSRKWLWILGLAFIAEVVALVVLSLCWNRPRESCVHMSTKTVFYPCSTVFLRAEPVSIGCHTAPHGIHFMIYALPILVVSLGGFLMTIYRCVKMLRASRPFRMPMVELYLHDGILYVLAAVPIVVVSILLPQIAKSTLGVATVSMQCALNSVVASRVLHNLRQTTTEESHLLVQETHIELAVREIAQGPVNIDHTSSVSCVREVP
ncbi:hypothetical protein CERSUDRAFT_112139 [Gelatoporia subvermispora B]|uniref:DUF6533 domain-containing protein n=1 Tax=Ceriporiopsis subvermispora (strain B) TaxID=914234 RepID=M2PT67_CERS8|nr:hypothetical protein CERSUDRAFT_112139 [Gelatoporia subvermispora B]